MALVRGYPMPEQKEANPNLIGGQTPSADGSSDAEMDAWLEANPQGADEPHGEPAAKAQDAGAREGQPPADKPRDEKGRFTKADESEDTAEPTASADSVNPEDYRRALNALKRSHTPQAVIDSLDPAKTIEWGLKLASTQAETDGFGKQVSDLKAELAKLAGTDSKVAEPGVIDIDAKLQPFREYFGDEAAEPLKELLEAFQTAAAPTTDSATKEMLDKLAAQLQERDQRDARRELAEKHPEFRVGNDDRWQKALDFRRGDRNDHASELEALTTACRHVFADEIIADFQAKLGEQHKLRDNGQPTAPESGGTPAEVETLDALEDRFLNAQHDNNQAEMDRVRKLIAARAQTGLPSWEEMQKPIGVRSR